MGYNIIRISVHKSPRGYFLSCGAPNQPGSILIGTLIIITYLNSYDSISMAIYLEVFLGGILNIINVISDIVTVAEEEGVRYEG